MRSRDKPPQEDGGDFPAALQLATLGEEDWKPQAALWKAKAEENPGPGGCCGPWPLASALSSRESLSKDGNKSCGYRMTLKSSRKLRKPKMTKYVRVSRKLPEDPLPAGVRKRAYFLGTTSGSAP